MHFGRFSRHFLDTCSRPDTEHFRPALSCSLALFLSLSFKLFAVSSIKGKIPLWVIVWYRLPSMSSECLMTSEFARVKLKLQEEVLPTAMTPWLEFLPNNSCCLLLNQEQHPQLSRNKTGQGAPGRRESRRVLTVPWNWLLTHGHEFLLFSTM